MQTNLAKRQPSNDVERPGSGDLESIALLLDVDGTILDTAITPGSVVVPGSLRATLATLQTKCGGALALVSGRLIHNLDSLFAPLRLAAIGGHGAEIRLAGNLAAQARHADVIGEALRKLVAGAAAADPRVILEDKGSSLAVHYRLAPQMESTLKAKIDAIIARLALHDLEILHGKSVIEIKSGRFNKGVAVRELMKSPPFLGRRPVFIGDDTTDESVFELLPTLGGVGFAVERPIAGASGMFASPHEVRCWLESLCGADGISSP